MTTTQARKRRDAGDEYDLERGSYRLSGVVRLCRYRLVLLAATLLCVSLAGPAAAETRSLKLYFLHTKERATITYKKNGRYIPSGLKKVNRFLRDWRRNEPTKMDPRLLDLLWEVYQASGSKKHIHVVSAYRSPQTNAMLRKRSKGVARRSQHVLGRAIDFYLPDVKLSKLRRVAMQAQVGGVGYYPRSGSPFVHIDVGSVRSWPRMSRKELVSLFPKGKTLHLPKDGKPLPGYQQAMADYKSRVTAKEIRVAGKRSSGGNLLAGLFRGGNRDEEEAKPVRVTRKRSNPPAQPPAPKPRAPEPPAPQEPSVALAFIPTPQPRPTAGESGVALASLSTQEQPIQVALAPATTTPSGNGQVATPLFTAAFASDGSTIPIPSLPARTDLDAGTRVAIAQPAVTAGAFLLAPATTSIADTGLTPASIQTPADNPLAAGSEAPVSLAFVPRPQIRPNSASTEGLVIAAAYAPETSAVDSGLLVGGIPVPQPSPFGSLGGKTERPGAPVAVALAPPTEASPRANGILDSAFAPLARQNSVKGARPNASDAQQSRRASVRKEPVLTPNLVTNRAFATHSVTSMQGPARLPHFVSAHMRSAPDTVHLEGFSIDNEVAVADRFAGRAVNFMTVARFVSSN